MDMFLISVLQCYFCQGSDYDSCVTGDDDQRVTCQEDEECYVFRKHTYLNYYRKPKFEFEDDFLESLVGYQIPENKWIVGFPPNEDEEYEFHVEILVEAWRGCKPINHRFEYPNNVSIEIFVQSCSSNLCNLGLSYGPGEGAYIGAANQPGIFRTEK